MVLSKAPVGRGIYQHWAAFLAGVHDTSLAGFSASLVGFGVALQVVAAQWMFALADLVELAMCSSGPPNGAVVNRQAPPEVDRDRKLLQYFLAARRCLSESRCVGLAIDYSRVGARSTANGVVSTPGNLVVWAPPQVGAVCRVGSREVPKWPPEKWICMGAAGAQGREQNMYIRFSRGVKMGISLGTSAIFGFVYTFLFRFHTNVCLAFCQTFVYTTRVFLFYRREDSILGSGAFVYTKILR